MGVLAIHAQQKSWEYQTNRDMQIKIDAQQEAITQTKDKVDDMERRLTKLEDLNEGNRTLLVGVLVSAGLLLGGQVLLLVQKQRQFMRYRKDDYLHHRT